MNALTQGNSGAVSAQSHANPFAAAGAGAGNSTYVKFKGASGDFLCGQDEEEMDHGTELAFDLANSQFVWAFWWEEEVLETITTLVIDNPMAWNREPNHLPEKYDGDMSLEEIRAKQADRSSNFMDGWGCQAVVGMREVGGENEEFTLKLNAGVGLTAFRALLGNFGKQYLKKEGLTPLVQIGASSYQSKVKGVGKRYSPTFKITDWLSDDAMMGGDAEYDDEVPERAAPAQITAPEPTTEPARGARRGARGANYGDK